MREGIDMRMIIAGGGTGGHLFPGIAVAEEVLKRKPQNDVLFIGTYRGLENRVLKNLGFSLRFIDIEGIKGKSMAKAWQSMNKIPKSLIQASTIIRDFSPDIVLGVGGYASGPAVMAAHFMGIKTAIAEQNALPGLTNRILGKFADRVFLTFEQTKKWFSPPKTMVTGNPIRSAFFRKGLATKEAKVHFTILIFGGSQGAHAINMAVINALEYLKDIMNQLKFIHQTGNSDMEPVSNAYRESGFYAEVFPFITDMASAYSAADLLICRSGATSVTEITASGKAALLIPYPYAIGDHQSKNAEVLLEAGAAEIIPEKELSGQKLADDIKRLYNHPETIMEMEAASAKLGNIQAAARIVDACIELVSSK
jgi:UDP-N-acetylglucosamine--N-acetylmuramyl-(pentapeptide) pyrophosphoryl-undecaprenol N-acetylglucosamine transferase